MNKNNNTPEKKPNMTSEEISAFLIGNLKANLAVEIPENERIMKQAKLYAQAERAKQLEQEKRNSTTDQIGRLSPHIK
jgi:hypothetical protein